MKLAVTSIILALVSTPALFAQSGAQQTPYVVGSTVSGHVTCGDTGGPARFAKVLLKSATPNHTGEDFMKSIQDSIQKSAAKSGESVPAAKPMTEEQKRAMANAAKGMNQATDMLNSSTVGLDGSYSFAGVKAGTYYVHAIFAGYIDPISHFSDEDFASTDPAMRARIAQIPTITVTGTDSARVDLQLDRGSAISGRILYDDGSPAAGWTLSVIGHDAPDSDVDASSVMMAQLRFPRLTISATIASPALPQETMHCVLRLSRHLLASAPQTLVMAEAVSISQSIQAIPSAVPMRNPSPLLPGKRKWA